MDEKKLILFYLTHCPYCKMAARAIEELTAEEPAYAAIPIERIEETLQPEISEKYDYWRVPTFFYGEEKLYEADPSQGYEEIRANVKRVFDTVLG